jgi:hypothetical protein
VVASIRIAQTEKENQFDELAVAGSRTVISLPVGSFSANSTSPPEYVTI